MTKKESNLLLFSITLCWASSYVFIKDLPENLSSFAYLTLTSGIAGIVLLVIFFRSLKHLDRKTTLWSLGLAALLAGNILLEKMGLEHIPSSTASFIASLNIVIVPIILLFFRQLPTKNNILGIAIILFGIVVSAIGSLQSGSVVGMLLMLGSSAMMSVYTVIATKFAKETDPLLLSVMQICFCALIGFVFWTIEDPKTFANISWTPSMLSSIFVLAFFSKAYAYIMLMYGEKYADAISVTVVAAMEPIVTLVLAILIPNSSGNTEVFSVRRLAGATVIAAGAIVAGTNFLSKKNPFSFSPMEPAEEVKTEENKTQLASSPIKQFFITMIPFAVLGAAFKTMTLVEGFTEVRPGNAIPVVSGLAFGWIGGIGCAVGNLIADCFGPLGMTSILGMIGNFMAAYIPFRMWYALIGKRPHVHTWKNLVLYVWVSLLGALACAWILGFGLEAFFGIWDETIYKYIFLNNFGFSLALGLPVFILLTSDSFNLHWRRPGRLSNPLKLKSGRWVILWIIACTATLLAVLIGALSGLHLSNSLFIKVMSVISVVTIVGMCILPSKQKETSA